MVELNVNARIIATLMETNAFLPTKTNKNANANNRKSNKKINKGGTFPNSQPHGDLPLNKPKRKGTSHG
jgi:hypothetical protein